MDNLPFWELLAAAQQRSNSTLAIGLAPALNKLPYESQRWDDPFLPFGKAVIDTTNDLVCAYVFHLGAYLALGAAGAVALERTMAYVPSGVVKILHGPFASDEYVTAAFEEGFGANAVTLAMGLAGWPTMNVLPYVHNVQHGAFIRGTAMNQAMIDIGFYADPNNRKQIGIYRAIDNDHIFMGISNLHLHWHTEKIIYASWQQDFRQWMRTAATTARTAPAPLEGHND